MSKKLVLEVNKEFVKDTETSNLEARGIMVTPPVGDEYWLFRVKLSKNQSVIAFPKFGTIGIGFAKETDWNTNLPYQCESTEIYNHIKHNLGKGNWGKSIKKRVINAIETLQGASLSFMESVQGCSSCQGCGDGNGCN